MAKDSDPEHGIYRVQFIGKERGVWVMLIGDLIFQEGEPHLVIRWDGPPNNQHPGLTQPLDPKRLSELRSDTTDFLYDGQIEDPRRLQ